MAAKKKGGKKNSKQSTEKFSNMNGNGADSSRFAPSCFATTNHFILTLAPFSLPRASSMDHDSQQSPAEDIPLEQQASGSRPLEAEETVDPAVRAEQLKEEGNGAFREKLYGTAIDLYSKAIGTCSCSSLCL